MGRFGLESHKYGVFAHCTDIGSNNSESIVCRRQHRHSVGLRNCVQHFDFHMPPPIVRDERYTSVRSMCVNEKKVQDRGSNPEPGARGIANPTERNGHPKTHPPNPRMGHPRTRRFAQGRWVRHPAERNPRAHPLETKDGAPSVNWLDTPPPPVF